MDIDDRAPAVARGEIEIAADAESVWNVLTSIDKWPTWNPDVKWAVLEGELEPGTRFRWKAGPAKLTSTLQTVDRPRRIVWTGKTMSIRAIHVYVLEARDGKTLVRSEESWDGPLVRILTGSLRKTLQESTDSGLQRLRAAAEGRG